MFLCFSDFQLTCISHFETPIKVWRGLIVEETNDYVDCTPLLVSLADVERLWLNLALPLLYNKLGLSEWLRYRRPSSKGSLGRILTDNEWLLNWIWNLMVSHWTVEPLVTKTALNLWSRQSLSYISKILICPFQRILRSRENWRDLSKFRENDLLVKILLVRAWQFSSQQ